MVKVGDPVWFSYYDSKTKLFRPAYNYVKLIKAEISHRDGGNDFRIEIEVEEWSRSWSAKELYASHDDVEKHLRSIEIADGKTVRPGDTVYIWHKNPNYSTLVMKEVAIVDRKQNKLACVYTFDERRRPYAIDPSRCYSTLKRAVASAPEKSLLPQHCLIGMGRQFQKKKIAV